MAGRVSGAGGCLAMDMVEQAGSGNPGTAMALAPLNYVLLRRFLSANPEDPHWPGRDRFVLSSGHACVCSMRCFI
jgi:transketolase